MPLESTTSALPSNESNDMRLNIQVMIVVGVLLALAAAGATFGIVGEEGEEAEKVWTMLLWLPIPEAFFVLMFGVLICSDQGLRSVMSFVLPTWCIIGTGAALGVLYRAGAGSGALSAWDYVWACTHVALLAAVAPTAFGVSMCMKLPVSTSQATTRSDSRPPQRPSPDSRCP